MNSFQNETIYRLTALEQKTEPLATFEYSRMLVAPFLELPGLVAFWPMSSVQRSTGNVYDVSGQGRTLTYNGNPTYNVYNNLIPYLDLDGTGDYLSRADETDLDILGTETIFASGVRGLTIGGWFWFDSLAANNFFSKWAPFTNQRSYLMYYDGSNVTAAVSTNGSAATTIAGASLVSEKWFFLVGRYTPSTELAIFANAEKAVNTTSIPASIFNSTASLTIGARSDATSLMDGRVALPFLSANAISDAKISSLFQQTRGFFGV